MIFGPRATIPAPPSPLATILFELAEAGVKASPLSVLCRASDKGLSDDEVAALVTALDKVAFPDQVAA